MRALLSTTITEYPGLPSGAGANGIASDGAHLWVAEALNTTTPAINQIVEVDPSTGAAIGNPIPVPALSGASAPSAPYSIVVDQQGRVWFTEDSDGGIGMYNPNNPAAGVASYPLPKSSGGAYDQHSDPVGITVAPNGNIWFTEKADNLIGTINPANPPANAAAVQVYPVDGGNTLSPDQIISTADGKIWFTEYDGDAIGEFDPSNPGGGVTQIPIQNTTGMKSLGIAVAGGSLWVGEENLGGTYGAVVRVNPADTTQQTVYSDNASGASSYGVAYVTAGSDGNVWFTEASGSNIGMIDPSSSSTTPTLQSTGQGGSQPVQIVQGPSGIVWFTDPGTQAVGVVTSTSTSTPTPTPTTPTITWADPASIVAGTPLSSTQLDAVATVNGVVIPGSYTYSPAAGTILAAGTDALSVTFAPSDTTHYTTATATAMIVVTTPTPTPTPTPTVVAAQLNSYYARHNKKGKPIGKPDAQVTVTFGAAMDTGTIDNAGIYTVEWETLKKVKTRVQVGKKFKTVTKTVPVFTPAAATFQPVGSSGNTVVLQTTVPLKKFAKGGQVVVTYPGASPGSADVPLGGSTTITI